MNEEMGWCLAFCITLVLLMICFSVAKSAVESNSALRKDLDGMTNNSLIWQRTANKNLDILLDYKDSQKENLEGNCVMDCYKFQLAWGYYDANYCTKYCEEKYEVRDR